MSNRTVIDAGLDRRARSDNVLTLAWEDHAYRRVPMARLLEFAVLGTGLDRRAWPTPRCFLGRNVPITDAQMLL